MKVSLIALVAGCAVAASALADSIPATPPHVILADSIPATPPHVILADSIPATPPHLI